jgi:hypothetical protein
MVDPQDQPITMSAAAKEWSRLTGQARSPSTFVRWGKHGLAFADGSIVRLAITRQGRKYHTTARALSDFLQALHARGRPPDRP